jgi:hypothetical protein
MSSEPDMLRATWHSNRGVRATRDVPTSLLSQFDTSIMTTFNPFNSRADDGLSFHAQLCSSKCLTTRLVKLELRLRNAPSSAMRSRARQRLGAGNVPARHNSSPPEVSGHHASGTQTSVCTSAPTSHAVRPAAS